MVTWTLDSCGCQVVLHKANSDPLDDTWICDQVLRICPIHINEPTNQDLLQALLSENRRRQGVRKVLLDNAPAQMILTNPDGSITFRDNILLTWEWSGVRPDRTLTVTLTGHTLTTNQKNAVQTKINQRYPNLNIIFVNN